jgi:hypothetical protein
VKYRLIPHVRGRDGPAVHEGAAHRMTPGEAAML